MRVKWFMISLLPALILSDILMWNCVGWMRFLTIYWQIVSWVAVFIILNYWLANTREGE